MPTNNTEVSTTPHQNVNLSDLQGYHEWLNELKASNRNKPRFITMNTPLHGRVPKDHPLSDMIVSSKSRNEDTTEPTLTIRVSKNRVINPDVDVSNFTVYSESGWDIGASTTDLRGLQDK